MIFRGHHRIPRISNQKNPIDTPISNWFKNRIKFVAVNKVPTISIAKYRYVGFFMYSRIPRFAHKKLINSFLYFFVGYPTILCLLTVATTSRDTADIHPYVPVLQKQLQQRVYLPCKSLHTSDLHMTRL